MFKNYPWNLSKIRLHSITQIYSYILLVSIQSQGFDLIPMLNVKDLVAKNVQIFLEKSLKIHWKTKVTISKTWQPLIDGSFYQSSQTPDRSDKNSCRNNLSKIRKDGQWPAGRCRGKCLVCPYALKYKWFSLTLIRKYRFFLFTFHLYRNTCVKVVTSTKYIFFCTSVSVKRDIANRFLSNSFELH